MAQRRFHYEQAFEHYLRANAIPYVAVDEAKKALASTGPLKSFDFVVYSASGANLLIDVKGRKHSGKSRRALDNWVTEDDIADLRQWSHVFGDGFRPMLVFLYWCAAQPPDALFQEIFEYRERWYAVLSIGVEQYAEHMVQRSPKWKTVHVPAAVFGRVSRPLGELCRDAIAPDPRNPRNPRNPQTEPAIDVQTLAQPANPSPPRTSNR